MTQMEYNDFHLFGRLVNRPSEQPTTVPIRRINVKFSTKAETLQAQQAGAQLFVCAEASQLSNPTALASSPPLKKVKISPTPKSRRTTVCKPLPLPASKKPTAPH